MTPERWQRIEELVEAVREHEPGDRKKFLEAECGGDDALGRQVEAILESYDRVDSFLENPAALDLEPTERGPVPPPLQATGALDLIGPYRLQGEIGHGGMGSVFRATRGDGEYQQQVAIKLIRPGLDSESVARRFRGERQILANLDHPNIARLFDGGTTDDGRPYFVMELIEGTRIDDYCDRRRASLRERIGLFGQVCAAVAYAHRNLVVHRDLKPGNILVTEDGVPKLLDFGIAKLLDPEAFPHTVEATHGPGPMTPPYASPEQILNQLITTASDVYSLGVLLYKLLTGRLPFDRTRPAHEIVEDLAQPPTRPSVAVSLPAESGSADGAEMRWSLQRRLSPQQLSRRLKGDLDNIVLKALRREPERRYGSAEQLAADLARHLEGLPVLARRASLRYRTAKFLRRHRMGVAVAGGVLALILGSAGVVALQSVEISRQRDLAEERLDHAEKVSDALIDLFETLDPNETTGQSITAKEILDRGVDNLVVELQDQPRIQAAVQTAIGKVYFKLGLYQQAQPLLEDALQARRQLFGEEHLEVAESQHELAKLYSIQDDSRGEGLHRRALQIRQDLLGPDHADIARSLRGLGSHYYQTSRPSRALLYLKQALDMGQKHLESVEIADILEAIANVHLHNQEPELAEISFQRALEAQEAARGPGHFRLSPTLAALAWIKCEQGDYTPGTSLGRRALQIQEGHLGPQHPSVGNLLDSLAYCHSNQGENDQAVTYASRALEIDQATFGADSLRASVALHNLAIIHFRNSDFRISERLLLRSLQIQETLGTANPQLFATLSLLGRVNEQLGKLDLATDLHRRAVETSEYLLTQDPDDRMPKIIMAISRVGLGEIHRKEGRHEETQSSYLDALSIFDSLQHTRPATRIHQALAFTRVGRLDEARSILEELQARGWRTPEFLQLCIEHGLSGADDT